MFDFRQVAPGLYVIYKNGVLVTIPLTREELNKEIQALPLSDEEIHMINALFDSESEDLIRSRESE